MNRVGRELPAHSGLQSTAPTCNPGVGQQARWIDLEIFALDAERREGKNSRDAIYEACLLRFRPIMMTTMAAMLGGVPLAIGGGAVELQRLQLDEQPIEKSD